MNRSTPARRQVRVAVVGAGAAGLVAARDLARGGADVVLLDEQSSPGGQYYRRRAGAIRQRHGDVRPRGTSLIAEARDAGVELRSHTTVWGVDDDGRTLLTTTRGQTGFEAVGADAVVVATGAHERSVPFPGWLLPGVMTPGAALHLAKIDRVLPGQRMVVAGSGPFLLPVAVALLELGCDVAAVIEHARPFRLSRAGTAAGRSPEKLRELATYLRTLARHRVALRQGWQVAGADAGSGGDVQRVHLRGRGGRAESIEVDALAVGYGFRPNTELLSLLGAPMHVDPRSHDRIPVVDAYGRCDLEGVYAAGETCGIAGAAAAAVRGGLAALAVAEDFDLRRVNSTLKRRLLARGEAHRRFTTALNLLYGVPLDLAGHIPDEVTVCRCEVVTAGEIRLAATTGWNDLNGAKGSTRAGMGPCQGRQCAFAAACLVQNATGHEPGAPFSTRTPIKPILVSDLVGDPMIVDQARR